MTSVQLVGHNTNEVQACVLAPSVFYVYYAIKSRTWVLCRSSHYSADEVQKGGNTNTEVGSKSRATEIDEVGVCCSYSQECHKAWSVSQLSFPLTLGLNLSQVRSLWRKCTSIPRFEVWNWEGDKTASWLSLQENSYVWSSITWPIICCTQTAILQHFTKI